MLDKDRNVWHILRSSQKASDLLREGREAPLGAKLACEDAGVSHHLFTDLRGWGVICSQ